MTQTVHAPRSPLDTDLYVGGKHVPASRRRPLRRSRPGHRATLIASVADGTVEDALAAVDAAATRRPRRGPRRLRASAPRSCGRAFELMTAQRRGAGPADLAGERQGARATPAARSPTRPSSSAGTPRRRCAASAADHGAVGREPDPGAAASRSASACWSRRGTSRRRWPPARSGPRWPPAAPSCSSPPATPR